jgi:hypothetical protein
VIDPIVVFNQILIVDYGFHLNDFILSPLYNFIMKIVLEVLYVWGAVLSVQKIVHKLLHFLLEWAIYTQVNLWEGFFFIEIRWCLLILYV